MEEKRVYGILAAEMEKIISIFRDDPRIDEVILFGSRAKGTHMPGSDIDLAIKGPSLNLDDLLRLSLATENLSLPNKVDIVIYDRIREKALKDHIDRVGIVLYERKTMAKQKRTDQVAEDHPRGYGKEKE